MLACSCARRTPYQCLFPAYLQSKWLNVIVETTLKVNGSSNRRALLPPPTSQQQPVLNSQPFSCLMERSRGPDDTLGEKFTWSSVGDDLILVAPKKK